MSSAGSRFERFMSHLDEVSGNLEPEFHRVDAWQLERDEYDPRRPSALA